MGKKIKNNKEICRCIKTKYEVEYCGHFLKCECGYDLNTEEASYCGGCGRRIDVIGKIGEPSNF